MSDGTSKLSRTQREAESKLDEQAGEHETASSELFELVSQSRGAAPIIDGVVIGTVTGLADSGAPLVDFPENPTRDPILARGVVRVSDEQVGREVALMFENGRATSPIVVGLIHQPEDSSPLDVTVDRKRVVLEAEREIELRCGDASILLTSDGKVRIRGKDILTRASGGNRIKGGSVRIN